MGRSYATYNKDVKATYGIDKTAQMRPAWSTQRVPAQSGPRSESQASREAFLLRWQARVTGGGLRASAYLVDRGVLPQRQVPEAAADLVSALSDCGRRRGRERSTLERQAGAWAPRRPGGQGGSSPCTTTDWVIPARGPAPEAVPLRLPPRHSSPKTRYDRRP